ncbi:hypothetical protein MRB53_012695 [Persea americana]|uniref:Uncharacterized protein n=1 Tax=Persea americana TaxID=3435 RepID=A0ACC2LZ00_PERAE|nr:hypothetical protein MRB53_012695 [Persea americana]
MARPVIPQAPLLLLPRSFTGLAFFFNLSNKKITYTMSLSCPVCFGYSFRCISSSCGWLLFECESMCMKCTSFLYNPLMEKCIRLPRVLKHSCYVDCLYFSTRVDPIGVLFARKSNNTFLLYRLKYPCRSPKIIFSVLYGLKDLCCSPFHQYEWKETVVSNTIFCQGKLYTLNDQDWSLSVEDPLFPRKKITCLKIKLEVERKYPLFMREEPTSSLSISTPKNKGNSIYYIPKSTAVSYVEYELDGDEPTAHSIGHGGGIGCAWIQLGLCPFG